MEFPVSSAGIRAALDYVAAETASLGADARIGHRLSVIVDELVANMIRHDPALGPGQDFRLELTPAGAAVNLRISDPGTAFDPVGHVPGEVPEIGGHGLHVVRSLARSFSYRREDGRNLIEVRVDAAELDV